tara:strand:- start:45 stop:803 length:759 start_codon:yes stop_codon:yes gene_type:complete
MAVAVGFVLFFLRCILRNDLMKLLTIAAAVMSVASMGAQAKLVDSSLFTEGDNKVTLHEETGIEWLKLDVTDGMSFNEIAEEMVSGGQFEGWRFPTYSEVLVYTEEALKHVDDLMFGDRTDSVTNAYVNDSRNVMKTLGVTDGSIYSRNGATVNGLYYDDDGELRYTAAYTNGTHTYSGYIRYNARKTQEKDVANELNGFFLVSDGGTTWSSLNDPMLNINNPDAPINDVPAPLMGAFIGLAMMGMRRKLKP